MSFRNEYDGHTIESSLEQVERLTGRKIKLLAGDRGYRGKKEINGTKIMIPDVPKKSDSRYQRLKKHMLFCKRAGIEPTIGHLKSDYRLGRNFYKGVVGDAVNVLLSAAYNFKRAMKALLGMLQKICEILYLNNISQKWAFKGRLYKDVSSALHASFYSSQMPSDFLTKFHKAIIGMAFFNLNTTACNQSFALDVDHHNLWCLI